MIDLVLEVFEYMVYFVLECCDWVVFVVFGIWCVVFVCSGNEVFDL